MVRLRGRLCLQGAWFDSLGQCWIPSMPQVKDSVKQGNMAGVGVIGVDVSWEAGDVRSRRAADWRHEAKDVDHG